MDTAWLEAPEESSHRGHWGDPGPGGELVVTEHPVTSGGSGQYGARTSSRGLTLDLAASRVE